jgi:hypothetical protein
MTTPRTSFLDIAQTFTAYVAIPVALVYPLGFVALFLQFTRYFGLEFYTASYAVSLVNRTIVIGQGATIFGVALFGSALLAGIVAWILIQYEDRVGTHTATRRRSRYLILAVAFAIVFALYVLYSRILGAGRLSWSAVRGVQSGECIDEAMRHQLNLLPDSLIPAAIFAVGTSCGGWLIYNSYKRFRQRPFADNRQLRSMFRFFAGGITQRWILSGLTVAYAAGVLASLTLTLATPAFMPYINFGFTYPDSRQPPPYTAEPVKQPTSDRFLSHAEGHWNFLHRGRNREGEREYRIISLREDEVRYSRVIPYPDPNPRVAPFPWAHPSTGDLKLCFEPPVHLRRHPH